MDRGLSPSRAGGVKGGHALVAVLLLLLLLLLTVRSGLFCGTDSHLLRTSAPNGAAADPTALVLPGGRLFTCEEGINAESCRASLLSELAAENMALRAESAVAACAAAPEGGVAPSGAFCLTVDKPQVGGNALRDEGVEAAFCAAATARGGDTIVDLGAGKGQYGPGLEACGFRWRGFDGAANVAAVTNGKVAWLDLSVPVFVGAADWVLSLEVGEHVPAPFAHVYLDNIARHARMGLLLSWAVPGQPGHHHVNGADNGWVIAQMRDRGFAYDAGVSEKLRAASTFFWFADTLMLFTRESGQAGVPGSVSVAGAVV